MTRTKKYFEKRVGRLASMLEFADDWQVQLHCYTPGNQRLYQIQIVDRRDGSVMISLPRTRSYNSHEFEIYLDGIFAGGIKLEGMWKEI